MDYEQKIHEENVAAEEDMLVIESARDERDAQLLIPNLDQEPVEESVEESTKELTIKDAFDF